MRLAMLAVLTQAQQSITDVVAGIYKPLLLLLVAALALAVVFFVLRRVLSRDEEQDEAVTGFTLADMRRMHAEGRLSDEEFAAAKAAVIGRSVQAAHLYEEPDEADQVDLPDEPDRREDAAPPGEPPDTPPGEPRS